MRYSLFNDAETMCLHSDEQRASYLEKFSAALESLIYAEIVPRLISITLLLLFGLQLAGPAFALGGNADSRMAACCRRNGAHHCRMSPEEKAKLEAGQHVTVVHSNCPMFPKALAPAHHETLSIHLAAALYAEVLSHPAQFRQVEAWARVARDGARQKRGPPTASAVI
jgi:hypothetical protein